MSSKAAARQVKKRKRVADAGDNAFKAKSVKRAKTSAKKAITVHAKSVGHCVKTVTRNDLNCLRLPQIAARGWSPCTVVKQNSKISVYFDSLAHHLCNAIDKAEQVAGCVAWMTNESVLASLKRKSAVSLIVQNDDMGYRAGSTGKGRFQTTQQCKAWAQKLQEHYSGLTGCFLDRENMTGKQKSGPIAEFLIRDTFWNSVVAVRVTKNCGSAEKKWLETVYGQNTRETRKKVEKQQLVIVGNVRALGERSTQQNSHVSRMHHKFFVFFDSDGPYAVWTGSYNPTGMAEQSLENAVLIESREVAAAYAAEHAQLLFQSVPLSWSGLSAIGTTFQNASARSFALQ